MAENTTEGGLAVCGFGMDLNQITLETVELLMKTEIVFSDAIEEREKKIVRGWCSDVRDLNVLAGPGEHRDVAPRKIALVLEAVAAGKRVAILNFGHPTFLSSLAQGLIDACKERGFAYRVVNAVSSLGAVLASLELTGLWDGLHVYDADDYSGLITVVPLQPKVPTIIVKVGYLLKPEQRERLEPFVARLLKFYPPDHPAVLVESPWISNKEGRRVETTIEGLGSAIENPNEFLTLYLPPTGGVHRAVATRADARTGLPADIEPGRQLADAGDFARAEAYFTTLLDKRADRVEALAWRACVRMSTGRFSESLPDLDAAIRLMPEPGWAHQLRAEARLMTGDTDGCVEDIERARLWKDHGAEIEILVSSVHLRRDDFEASERAMARAVESLGVDWAASWFWTFNEDVAEEKQNGLAEYARGRLAQSRDREWMALLLGNWALDEGRPEEAVEFFERAARAYPEAKVPGQRLEAAKAARA